MRGFGNETIWFFVHVIQVSALEFSANGNLFDIWTPSESFPLELVLDDEKVSKLEQEAVRRRKSGVTVESIRASVLQVGPAWRLAQRGAKRNMTFTSAGGASNLLVSRSFVESGETVGSVDATWSRMAQILRHRLTAQTGTQFSCNTDRTTIQLFMVTSFESPESQFEF